MYGPFTHLGEIALSLRRVNRGQPRWMQRSTVQLKSQWAQGFQGEAKVETQTFTMDRHKFCPVSHNIVEPSVG